MSNREKQPRKELLQALSFFSQISITIVTCLFVGLWIGRYLDGLFGTSPWLLLLFSLLGAGAAFKAILDLANRQ